LLNTYIWEHFWVNYPPMFLSKFWYLTPWGAHIYGTLMVFTSAINFEEIPPCFALNVFLWLLCINDRNWEVICLIPIFMGIFGQHFGI